MDVEMAMQLPAIAWWATGKLRSIANFGLLLLLLEVAIKVGVELDVGLFTCVLTLSGVAFCLAD
jgi:hypothetical protein